MAPDFELPGSAGKQVKLSSYRGHWLILAFGDRKETVSPLREVCAELDSSGIHLLGVCAEKTYFLSSFVNRESFPFTILADDTREISDLYGLYESRERKVLPGYILINPKGEIRLSMLGQTLPPGDVARVVKYVTTRL
jgi:peroxiredoxin Q/BCP